MRKNIKFLSILLTIIVLMSGVFVVPVSAADVNYSVSSAIGATGETVKVSVRLSSSVELWGANVSLAYNSDDLQVVNCVKGDVVGSASSLNDTGSAVNFSGMYTKTSGTVFTVEFKILKESGTSRLTLSSSENTDSNGVVHACSVSHSNITVSNNIDVPVEKITLDKTSVSLKKNGTHKLVVTVSPENTTNKTILFQSSNDNVATVSNDGVITATGGGTATITVKAGNKTATCKVTVNVPQTGIKAYGSTTRTAEIGKTLKLAVVKVPADTNDNFKTAWTSSDTKIATVDANGNVTPLADGVVKITAKSNNWTVVYTVTVGKGEEESSTEESTTEEPTTLLEEPSTEEFTTDVPVTEPVTQPVVVPIIPEDDFPLAEPTTYEDTQGDATKDPSYIYIVLLATAGIMTVVIGTVAFFVAKGYRGKNKKQKIVVEERYRGK
ncbi:MAG: Ig-like domain-containing protein [Clostridia bacterium]|nr:Ig-like domain-containing protein [Clostridia bacterium]